MPRSRRSGSRGSVDDEDEDMEEQAYDDDEDLDLPSKRQLRRKRRHPPQRTPKQKPSPTQQLLPSKEEIAEPKQSLNSPTSMAQDSKLFFSPFFQEHKPLEFYGRLLATVQQFAKTLDDCTNKEARSLAWKELLRVAGVGFVPPAKDSSISGTVLSQDTVTPAGPVFQTCINSLLWAHER